jgi:predicted Rossmann fold flavoprotein
VAADWDLVVIGAGAAGLIAATRAAEGGLRTLLLEKNNKPGVKILMSGGTRCNLTHATDRRGILAMFPANQAAFLQSALAAFGPDDLQEYVSGEGIALKTESTGKVFPASDSAVDIQQAFLGRLKRSGALLSTGEGVRNLARDGESSVWSIETSVRGITAERLLLTSGGQSYPGCGTTGDGYRWTRELGHSIVTPRPALVPLLVQLPWLNALQGITIPDVEVSVFDLASSQKQKPLAKSRQSFLFTHFGCSGPAALNVSRVVTEFEKLEQLRLHCDWLPEKKEDELRDWFLYEATQSGKRQVSTALAQLLPHRLAEALILNAGISSDRKLSELTKTERIALMRQIKQTEVPIHGTLGFIKAEVTAGGISLHEVNSRTLQSKIVPNLWIAGELLDIDGPIGGYNFQAAFSMGYLAARSLTGER